MQKLLIISFILIAFIASGQKQSRQDMLRSKLDSIISFNFKETEPGGSIQIMQADRVIYSRSFGLADINTQEKFTSETISNTGSISKTFVAYGILILHSQGKLSIEDPISKYFPEFKNKEIASKVRIKHLITHTSGLPDSRQVNKDSLFYLSAKDEENFAPLFYTEQLEFEPGSKWKYSNPSYNGLALIIEKVSGMKWQVFIEENIFKPSGMIHSKITDGPYPVKDVAHAYRNINGKFEEYDYGEYPTFAASGNGGVWSSVEELAKYVSAIKQCSFLDCKTIGFSQTAWQPENWIPENASTQGYSWVVEEQKNKYKMISHSGSQGGFRAHLFMIPQPDITIIWLTNNNRMMTGFVMKALTETGFLK